MSFIIGKKCVSTCDTACVEVCPVDCIDDEGDDESVKKNYEFFDQEWDG